MLASLCGTGVQAVQRNACALFHGKGTDKTFRSYRLLLACVVLAPVVLSLSLGPGLSEQLSSRAPTPSQCGAVYPDLGFHRHPTVGRSQGSLGQATLPKNPQIPTSTSNGAVSSRFPPHRGGRLH